MFDRIDHRLADGNPDPMDAVFVERRQQRHAIAHDLDEIQQLIVAGNLQANSSAARQHGYA
jgi:hypothetical protein